MKFEISKKKVIKRPKAISIIIENDDTWRALESAKKASGKMKTKLVLEMIIFCLKEAGYLK